MPTLNLLPTPCNSPVIELGIRGVIYRFLLDTGANISIVHSKIITITEPHKRRISVGQMTGINGPEFAIEVIRIDVRFNFFGVSIPSIVLSNRMDGIKQAIPFPISGLIGQDILTKFTEVVFNWKNQTVRFVV